MSQALFLEFLEVPMKIPLFYFMIWIAGTTNAQEQATIEKTEKAAKNVKFNINTGFHFSNMTGKDVQKDDNLFLSIHSENGKVKSYNDYNLNAGGYKAFLPGYKFGIGVTFDKTKNFAWGVDLNFVYNKVKGTPKNTKLCVMLLRQNAHLPQANSAFVSVASLDFGIFRSSL